MKKYMALFLTVLLVVALLAGCSSQKTASDSAKIKKAGKLVVGITDFAPMDYKGDDGSWIGFDADLARAFAESLGVKAEFTVIDWDNKTLELDAGNIDCIWNGMTLTDGVKAAMETSKPYCGNAQVVVAPKDKAAGLDYAALTFAVEAGSAAEELAKEKGWKIASMQSQGDALLEVASGASDACIIDQLMAGAMIGEGTSYPDLVLVEGLNAEEYGVGFRKGSNLAAKLDSFLDGKYKDGSLAEIAAKYGIDTKLIAR
ncbi:MAG: transporter substrate-binding domain-containing protein [Clostridia bacterium]|nr:transporter substrate-binding domain-containing protein [Clostridia bacterium]